MAKTKVISDTNAYRTYLDALDNPYTRRNYEIHFGEFRNALKASESCNELLTMDGRELEDKIVEHIKQMAKRKASTSSIRLTLSAIRKFFVENRQENRVNWSWLKNRIPRSNGKVKDRDYTKDEIVKMWEASDIRKKAILSLLMTGLRKGAIPDLRVGNLAKTTDYRDKEGRQHGFEGYHIYRLTVYEGDSAEYFTFTTPAGSKAIDRYLEARLTAGEKLTANSPLIRDVFDSVNAREPKPVTLWALDMAFTRLTRSVGIRPKKKVGKRQDRHDIMLFHAFRKYVNHALVNAGVGNIHKELLIGHNPPGLEGSYLRPTESELLSEFLKAIPALSLSQEAALRQQVDRLQMQVSDVDSMKDVYLRLRQDNDRQKQENQLLAAVVLANNEQEKQEAAARLREFYQVDSGGKPYPTQDLQVLDRAGAIEINQQPRIVSEKGGEQIQKPGEFIIPETGRSRLFLHLPADMRGDAEILFRNRKDQPRENGSRSA